MTPSAEEHAELASLETSMWREKTRFDLQFQEARFSEDFVEFGRSGRIYTRDQIIRTDSVPIDATLNNLQIRLIDQNSVLITYDSAAVNDGRIEYARRSSIWSHTQSGWVMRFHQGTPYIP